MAPELVKTGNINYTCDTYSLGLILYMLSNHNNLPFTEQYENVTVNTLNEATQRRLNAEAMTKPSHASEVLWKIIQKACAYNKNERYLTPEQLLSDLKSAMNNQPFDTAKKNETYSDAVNDEEAVSAVEPQVESFSDIPDERKLRVSIREEIHIPEFYLERFGSVAETETTPNSKKIEKFIDTTPKSRFDFRGLKRVFLSAFVAICCVLLFIVSMIISTSAAYFDESADDTTDLLYNFKFYSEGALLYGG